VIIVQGGRLPELLQIDPASLDDALKRANRNYLRRMHGHDCLSSILVAPLLVTAGLTQQPEAVAS
jgi:hypothetical protein